MNFAAGTVLPMAEGVAVLPSEKLAKLHHNNLNENALLLKNPSYLEGFFMPFIIDLTSF